MKTDYEKNLNLIEEAISSYKKGELSAMATTLTIYNIVSPPKVTEEDIRWVKSAIRNRKECVCKEII